MHWETLRLGPGYKDGPRWGRFDPRVGPSRAEWGRLGLSDFSLKTGPVRAEWGRVGAG